MNQGMNYDVYKAEGNGYITDMEERAAAMERLKEVCRGQGIRIIECDNRDDFITYYADDGFILVDVAAAAKNI